MIFLSIIFYIIGAGFLFYGVGLRTPHITQQSFQFMIYFLSLFCFAVGSILLAINKICRLLEKNQNDSTSLLSTATTNIWYCEKCGAENKGEKCAKCGAKKTKIYV